VGTIMLTPGSESSPVDVVVVNRLPLDRSFLYLALTINVVSYDK